MQNIVSLVFKICGLSLILLVFVGMGQILFDMYVMTDRVTTTTILLQNEIAKHNGLPLEETSGGGTEDKVAQMFEERLCRDVFQGTSVFRHVESNIGQSSQTGMFNGNPHNTYQFGSTFAGVPVEDPLHDLSIQEIGSGDAAAFDYGELVTLVVRVSMDPFSSRRNKKNDSSNYVNLDFVYTVPCLQFSA